MNIGDIERFSGVYKSGQRMGADRLLRRFLKLPDSSVIPLSISHGVDIFQWNEPIDIYKAEPIHWAYNLDLYRWSSQFKRTVLLPHPWAINSSTIEATRTILFWSKVEAVRKIRIRSGAGWA